MDLDITVQTQHRTAGPEIAPKTHFKDQQEAQLLLRNSMSATHACPIKFITYTEDVSELVTRHEVSYHLFADDIGYSCILPFFLTSCTSAANA